MIHLGISKIFKVTFVYSGLLFTSLDMKIFFVIIKHCARALRLKFFFSLVPHLTSVFFLTTGTNHIFSD